MTQRDPVMATKLVLCTLLLGLSGLSHAHWNLNNDFSRLSFVTIKAGNIGEVHRFKKLSGAVDDKGKLSFVVHTASVDTLIPIRDERMQEFLFESGLFPHATLTAQLDPTALAEIPTGGSSLIEVNGTLTVRDVEVAMATTVVVTRVASRRLQVHTLEPVLLNAAQFGLTDSVEKLRELAGLPSISQTVPVSFALTFDG